MKLSMLRAVGHYARRASRFTQPRQSFGPAVVSAVSAMMVVAGYVALAAGTLSPSQLLDRDFGTFDNYAGYGALTLAPGKALDEESLASSFAGAGIDGFMVSLTSPELPVSGLPDATARFHEAEWAGDPFPARYTELEGGWPTAPGEVVVSDSPGTDVGEVLEVAGGVANLTVVGEVQDAYAEQPAVLAAPGTWAMLPSSLQDSFVTLTAQPTMYWSGGEAGDALDVIVREFSAAPGSRPAADVAQAVRASFESGSEVADDGRGGIRAVPAEFYLPFLALPALAVLIAFLTRHRHMRRLRQVADDLGVRPRALVLPAAIGLTAVLLVGVIGGGLSGWVAALLAAPALERFLGNPVDVGILPLLPVGIAVVATLLTSAISAWWAARSSAGEPAEQQLIGMQRPSRKWRLTTVEVRRLAALLGACYAVVQVPQVSSPADATALATTVSISLLLLVPDVLPRVLARLPSRSWASRLARRRVEADGVRSSAFVMIVALTFSLALGFLTMLDSLLTTEINERRPDVGEDQVLVVNRASDLFNPNPDVLQSVREAIPSASEIPLSWTVALNRDGEISESGLIDGAIKPLLVLSSAGDVSRVLGRELSGDEAATLPDGVLSWGNEETALGDANSGELSLSLSDEGGRNEIARVPVRSAPTQFTGWQYGSSGVILNSTAQGYDLPVSEGAVLFTGVTSADAADLRDLVLRGGIDPLVVQTYEPPPPVIPQGALVLLALGASLAVFLLATGATWADSRAMRSLVATLQVCGVAPSEARKVVLLQHATLLGAGVVAGCVVTLPATLISASFLSGLAVSVPWAQATVLVSAILLGGLSASALGAVRARAAGSQPELGSFRH